MSYPEQLRKLTRRADATAASAAKLVARAIRGIRAELALLSEELNIGGSAADRERAYATIRERMAALSGRLDRLLRAQNELAGRYAAKAAARMTGLEVKFSARRTETIMELVTPAQGENLAAVFTENMANHAINALREATVAALREQAVSGGTLREMGKALGRRWTDALKEPPVFTDASGRTWDTATYLQMNVRTNSMRVYNDCLADDIARSTGSDFVRVSRGGNPTCRLCAPWEGAILSISGKASGFPSYEQARRAGCFHPNCVHTLEYADEAADAEEFALQRKFPVGAQANAEEMDERRYRMDQERYRRRGLSADEARLAVDRDNLADCIRHGLVRADARKLVEGLTDAQVTALCPDGNPPRFEPTKKATRADPHAADEKWVRGSRGGVVHVSRDADTAHLLEVCRVGGAKPEAKGWWKPTTPLERATDALMQSIGARHTDKPLGIEGTNPNFSNGREWRVNCQRCVPAYEARLRGYDVTALPTDGNQDGVRMWKDGMKDLVVCSGGKSFRRDIERTTASDPIGSRYLVRIRWNGSSSAHFFMARKTDDGMVYEDPQDSSRHAADFFNMASKSKRSNWYLRIDNREFTEDIKDCVRPA